MESSMFSEDDDWDVVDEIPNDSAAAVILLEHRWAIDLRDATARAGGFPISDGFIHPLDLVAVGLMAAEEAEAPTRPPRPANPNEGDSNDGRTKSCAPDGPADFTPPMEMNDSGGGYDEPAPAAAPAAPAAPDYAEELQKLAELKAAGVVDDEEFEAKKKQILGI